MVYHAGARTSRAETYDFADSDPGWHDDSGVAVGVTLGVARGFCSDPRPNTHGGACMAESPRLGFIGTGNMGRHMARHLLEAGFRLTVHDARRAAAEQLEGGGAGWAESPAELAEASDVVFTSLPGPPEVDSVALGEGGVLANLPDGGILVDLSTNSPTAIRKIAAAGAERGIVVLDAPVSGGVFGAETGRLAVMVGGERDAFERCKPMFD